MRLVFVYIIILLIDHHAYSPCRPTAALGLFLPAQLDTGTSAAARGTIPGQHRQVNTCLLQSLQRRFLSQQTLDTPAGPGERM